MKMRAGWTKSIIVVLAPHQPGAMTEKLGNEDEQHAGAEAVRRRPARQPLPQVFGVVAGNQEVGGDDQDEHQIEQPPAQPRILRVTKEIDDRLDHRITPSARVRK
ncbi:hypothetical protein BWO90_03860 (plasmid) [Sinorhizobium meliloti]|nr:hypothetical protein BWO76_03970 [Sinorhizobium meliloti]ATB01282.1 hypothetical protein BWO90_03860 [Sinorhizobium meliloti]